MTANLLMAAGKQRPASCLLPALVCADTSLVNVAQQLVSVVITRRGLRVTKPLAQNSLLYHLGHHLSQLSRL